MAIMKAVRIHTFGDPSVLTYEDAERPSPGAGEVLVRVHAAGINPVDWKTRMGNDGVANLLGVKPFPLILGWDTAGVIAELGVGVRQFNVGDAVYGMIRFPQAGQAYAEYVTAPVTEIALKPASSTYEQAAALPLVALTAWQSLIEIAQVHAGQTVLIHGAAGGVGHIAVQIAKSAGARVIGTASAQNSAFLRQVGVDTVVDYTQQAFEDVTGKVDVVFDTLGGDVQARSFAVIKPGGTLVSIVSNPDESRSRAAGITSHMVFVHPQAQHLTQIAELVDAGKLSIHVERIFPLRDARQAHELSESHHVRGKIVLAIAGN